MSRLYVIALLLFVSSYFPAQQISVATWNVQHLGNSKNQETINAIADIIKSFDVVAVQEVVGKTGSAAVERVVNRLNAGDSAKRWKASVSDITTGSPSESDRYAFFYNSHRVLLVSKPSLYTKYSKQIVREPYLATFSVSGLRFTLVNFHAVPKSRQPEQEIKYLKFFPAELPDQRIIFLGDFNVPQSNNVFNPLKKMGYAPAVVNQKTSLKMKCVGAECLASEYDNIFYNTANISIIASGIIPFYRNYPDMVAARKVSDHVPVYMVFTLR